MLGALTASLLAWTIAPVTAHAPEGLEHEALAREWFAAREADPSGKKLPDVLREEFVHLRLGAFDLAFPPGSFEEWSEAYAESIEGLLRVQEVWIGWIPALEGDTQRARALEQLALLRTWCKPLDKGLRKVEAEPGAELLALLEPGPEVSAAAAELAAYFGRGGPLARTGEPRWVPLVFAPERTMFVPLVCVIGLLDEPWRNVYWAPDIVTWTHCEWAGTRVVALEFATADASRDYTKSTSMTQENKRALAEHVVQLGSRQLFEQLGVPALFAVALANNVTIEIFGEVDTRNDGDTAARSVGPTEIFIPGALSDGVLPAADADSRWRREKGKEFFLPVLRRGQKDGAKKARSKWQQKTHFVIEAEQGDRHYASAPFFGPGEEVPAEQYLADYTEFLRSYRSGFLHWLQDVGIEEKPEPEQSRRAFGDFLVRVAAGEDMKQALAKSYPLPLSDENASDKSLEGRFLDWLSKQK